MRFKQPRHKDIRIRTWFAFIPITVNYDKRWLEWVYVKQEYFLKFDCGDCWRFWKNIEFVDKEA